MPAAHPFCALTRRLLAAAALGASVAVAHAGDPAPEGVPEELDALSLADRAEAPAKAPPRRWRVFGEAAGGREVGTGASATTSRLSVDARHDARWGENGPRAVLSARLDWTDRDDARPQDVMALREAYLGWSLDATRTLEVGRINVRHGAAMGYNPTDFFKGQALRSVVSPDPAVLRENRQGVFALQGQQLWPTGSLTALFAPDLGRAPVGDAYSLDAGATNDRARWMLALGQRWGDVLHPQLLVQGGASQSTQWGLNLSVPVGDAVVAFAELAWGRGQGVAESALGTGGSGRWLRRSALGLTVTTAFNLSLTVEAESNTAGLSGADWGALRPSDRAAVLAWASAMQELPARHALFVHAQWKNLVWPGLDLTGYLRRETSTGSRDRWLELRYSATSYELALQWQAYAGAGDSLFGSVPVQRATELQFRRYF